MAEWIETEEFPPPRDVIPTQVYYNSNQINRTNYTSRCSNVDGAASKVTGCDPSDMDKPSSLEDMEAYVSFRMSQVTVDLSSASGGSDNAIDTKKRTIPTTSTKGTSGTYSDQKTQTSANRRRSDNMFGQGGEYVISETDKEHNFAPTEQDEDSSASSSVSMETKCHASDTKRSKTNAFVDNLQKDKEKRKPLPFKTQKSSSQLKKKLHYDQGNKQDGRKPVNPKETLHSISVTDSGSKPKITTLFVKLAETIREEDMNILGYIKHRLQNKMEFTLTGQTVETHTGNTIISLQFPSRRAAQRLEADLKTDDAKSETKICCFYSFEDASKTTMSTKLKRDGMLNNYVREMTKRAASSLTKHKAKIDEVTEKLKKLKKSKDKFMSLEEYFVVDSERQALKDKQEELELQQKEFQNFITSAHQKFVEMLDSAVCDKPAISIMKAFGVECNRLDKALPMYARRSDILDIVKNNQVSVIIGETGSGKSTQMAQYLYQTEFANAGMIACTQPRKIAAISVATYVACEMSSSVGQVIGYKVGMQEKKTALTKVLFMTDHILLQECLKDRKLSSFSCIIIDEAHERSIYTDLLLGMLKSCLTVRTDLRVVITSATIDPEVFVQYFGQCPVLPVSGRMFPVDIIWKEQTAGQESFSNHIEECVRKAIDVHYNQPEGDILVFVTSPLESEKCCEKYKDYTKGKPQNFVCLQLHGKLQADEQRKVFDPPSVGKRKIVFATNSAETSVTIPGIRYVIDTGLVKEMKYDAKRKMNTLNVTTVTKSSANQRKGRAGRTGPGICYRLFTEDEYDRMETNMVPEILRVNLGQAMLKLIELNIDPLEFDFVMSPSAESMESAMETLEDIGAVSKRKITSLGKWISKLPLDPKLGVFIYDSLEIGAGLEGMVIAAAASGSSIFFRVGTAEEKDVSDLKKIPFCHVDGDMLTNLNVFREWSKQPEKSKGKWCYKNSINGKAIKGIRDIVNEILTTLKREMKITVPFKFEEPAKIDLLMIKPLLKVYRQNISHYLGHPKAGYVLVTKDQRVEIHPSSALMSLASQPEWIVYDQVMRTSRDFAMAITPISEDIVKRGIKEGVLDVDLEEAKAKRITPVHREYVGSEVLRQVVGPRYTYLREFEDKLVQKCHGSLVVVEADRNNGELKIFSKLSNQQTLDGSLENVLNPIKSNFIDEEREEKLGVKSTDRSVRAVVGAGGCTKTLFMPDEYNVVMIHCAVNKKEEFGYDDVYQHFSEFGKIKECKMYHHKKNAPSLWGQVTYKKTEDAVKAVAETRGNPDLSARPNRRMSNDRSEKFKVRIQWCRRRSRGFAFVNFASFLDADDAIRRSDILVGDSFAKIRKAHPSPNQSDEGKVFVVGLSKMVDEDVLRESIANAGDLDPNTDIERVTVVREKVPLEKKDLIDTMKRRLCAEISSYVAPGSYELELKPLREADHTFSAFVTFDNPQDGEGVCYKMDHSFIMNNQVVSAKPVLHCSLYIPKRIYEMSSDAIDQCVLDLEEDGVRVKTKTLRNENVVVDINTDDVETLVRARRSFQDITQGEIIECAESTSLKLLFTWEGRNKLKQIMNQTGTLILTDNRVMSVSIHGLQQNRQKAKQKIDEFLLMLSTGNSEVIDLKGEGKPPGVLKAILMKYKTDLSGLCQETGLVAARLDPRKHRVTLFGEDDAVTKTNAIITDIIANLSPDGLEKTDEPECVTCFCPIQQKDLYRVECCGHPYCKECLQVQIQMCITNREFPMKCEQDECTTPFTWHDIINLSKMGFVKVSELTDSSVSKFLQGNKKFRFCVTPDCPVVYRVTKTGKSFICPECDIKICTSCQVQFHDGLTCAMFKVEGNEDVSMRRWLEKNKANRKRCPNCATPIEKNGGCNHMSCLTCGKHICWLCLNFFDDSGACYGHLDKAHGSFV
ncbi:ATP-dependent RNA helicase DEAH12, chloroplastic-like isoform X2 [Mizuhopecten yessoensis]|uniref:ATP-dependent RNA helicase DEAH12, chloroplastic-like isoform X2 n=1 Tax=Mizuhopecten yessoensis TaxID=6573 RepID=UPI000B457655|nr:ATP-dependent RNA helicase DEAH12, chloroplastic-like isoform X2 [Mizuhopecten yessoensis]